MLLSVASKSTLLGGFGREPIELPQPCLGPLGLRHARFSLPSLNPVAFWTGGLVMVRLLALVGVLAILAAIAAAVFFLGGFYSVAAIGEDTGFIHWAIAQTRDASIARHATEAPPISLDDSMTVQAGARAFNERGCVHCHGAPGVMWSKFSEGLNPDPPDLKELASEAEPREVFWVVKNGIRMTGMPSFGAQEVPDQELWQIVAFVKKLPTVSADDYKSWTASPSAPTTPPAATPPPATPPG
jgi:mono/diheme cytochrome c family protein